MSKVSPEKNDKSRRFPDGFRILQGKQEYITYQAHSSIRVWPFEEACAYDCHYHSAMEVLLVLEGAVTYTLTDREYAVSAGEVLILPPGCAHAMIQPQGAKRYLYLFEPHVFHNLRDMALFIKQMDAPIYLKEASALRSQIQELLLEIADIYAARQPMWNSMCYALLVRMYALLGQKWMAGQSQSKSEGGGLESEMMNSVLTFIGQHYTEDLRLDDAASFSGFSKYYFSRAFKKFFGVSFTEYLCRCRLDTAMDLLIHTKLPIRQVAEKSGFGSVATFNRTFRSAYACPPSRYRSLYGNS